MQNILCARYTIPSPTPSIISVINLTKTYLKAGSIRNSLKFIHINSFRILDWRSLSLHLPHFVVCGPQWIQDSYITTFSPPTDFFGLEFTPEFLHLLLNFWPSVASLALNRGICCSSGCTHTPPQPSHTFDFSTAVEHILSIQLWHHSRGGRGILFSLPSLTLPLHNHVLTLSLPHILTGRVIGWMLEGDGRGGWEGWLQGQFRRLSCVKSGDPYSAFHLCDA